MIRWVHVNDRSANESQADARLDHQGKARSLIIVCMPLLSVFLFISGSEIVLRLYHFFRWDIAFFDTKLTKLESLSPISLDPVLGWRATEGYQFVGKKRNLDGSEYAVNISQDVNGFRMFGSLSSERDKVFVIGDSFTHATDVSDDRTYYAIVAKSLDVEVFAYGSGGYGSLQEYMILDKYFDLVKPTVILWQYSTNDFINNSPDLESASSINNNGMVRPYWINGAVAYILPKVRTKYIRRPALKYCRICYVVLNRVDRLLSAKSSKTVEIETSIGKPAHVAFLDSLKTTDEIMGMVRRRAGSIPILAFLAGSGSPYGPEYEKGITDISRRHNITLFPDIKQAVLAAEERGAVVKAADGAHWNELGHRIVGQAIAESQRRTCLLKFCETAVTTRRPRMDSMEEAPKF